MTAPPRVLVLALLVAALALTDAAVIAIDRRAEESRAPLAGSLVSFNPQAVHKVTVSRAQRPPIVLERRGSEWVVASHRGYPARPGRVDATLQRVLGWKRERLAGAANVGGFAITPDRAITIELEDEKGRPVASDPQGRPVSAVLVGSLTGVDTESARQHGGNLDPHSIGRYVRAAPDESVFVVNDFVSGELEPEPGEWLDRPLVSAEEGKVRALVLAGRDGAPLGLQFDPRDPRTSEGRPLDLERARALLRDVLSLAPTDVAQSDEELRLGLSSPRLTIDLALEGVPARARIQIGDEIAPSATVSYPGLSPPSQGASPPLVPVRVSGKPAVALVPAIATNRIFAASPESVVLEHAFGEHAPETVVRVELVRGDHSIVLSQEQGWGVSVVTSGSAGARRPLDSSKDAARLRVLAAVTTGLKVVGYDRAGVFSRAHGVSTPVLRLGIEIGKDRRDLMVGPVEGTSAWAQRSDMACLLELPAGAALELESAFDALATEDPGRR
jgi:hypothetical protein